MSRIDCDIAVIGGSLGGCAAAIHLANSGLRVALTEQTDWVGGQITSQGVSALDEHAHIEAFGAPQKYLELRTNIRRMIIEEYGVPPIMAESVLGANKPLNPGNGWVSRLCFLPRYGLRALQSLLPVAPILQHRPSKSILEGGAVTRLELAGIDHQPLQVQARYYLDATDTGDLLPLIGENQFVTGAESHADTGEPRAAAVARPGETQGFTYCFAVEYCAGENHTIQKPDGYEYFRDHQPYTLSPTGRDGQPVVYRMFEVSERGNLPFWSYRRLHDGSLLGGNDIALINWISNDYHGKNILEGTPADQARALDEAKRLSLGFLYWLQTECPRDEGGFGYPELKLRPDIMDTADGLSKAPYIRESRRIHALDRIVEQDITAEYHSGARARHFANSVGIGWYAMDLHPCVGNPTVSLYAPTKPFQIPLGALISRSTSNVIAACKNIGTTHLTNGAYRLHPVEWAVGEAAAALAAFCITHEVTPAQVHADQWLTWCLQAALVKRGCPVFWAVDVPTDHPLFVPSQLLLVRDVIVPDSDRWHRLDIGVDQPIGDSIRRDQLMALADHLNTKISTARVQMNAINKDTTWAAVCEAFTPALSALA